MESDKIKLTNKLKNQLGKKKKVHIDLSFIPHC